MSNFSLKSLRLLFVAAATSVALNACTDAGTEIDPTDEEENKVEVPTNYTFESRFDAGVSSVFYGGQTVRQLQILDLKKLIGDAADAGDAEFKNKFLAIYNYDDATDMSTMVGTGSLSALTAKYSEIATGKNLGGKISDAAVIGYGDKTAEDLIMMWVDKIQMNISQGLTGKAAIVDADTKVDYQQLIEKTLHGAVSYSQGTAKYLTNAPSENNTEAKASGDNVSPYSVQEHVWDEAFGYFGGARDYFQFSDNDLAGKDGGVNYKDLNEDGKIDFQAEYNFGISTNAGKRDRNHTTDFTKEIFTAFLEGRTAIVNEEGPEAVAGYAMKAAQVWEKVIAATAVHYINETIVDMNGVDVGSDDHAKHWSELKGFLIALQYGAEAYRLMDTETLTALQAKVGNQPVVAAEELDAYETALLEVRDTLEAVYGFNKEDVKTW